MEPSPLKMKLERLLTLLKDYHEPKWQAYFLKADKFLVAGKLERCKKQIRSAYGGMGSFNDSLYFTGAPQEIADEGFQLRKDLYILSEPKGLIGFLLRFTS